MSERRGTLEALIGELTRLFAPLMTLTPQSGHLLLRELGLAVTQQKAQAVAGALAKTRNAIAGLLDLKLQLDVAIELDDGVKVGAKGSAAVAQIAKLIAGLAELKAALAGLNLPNAAPIVAKLPAVLINHLLTGYLARSPFVLPALQLTKVLERVDHNVASIDPDVPFYTSSDFHFDLISGWLGGPSGQLAGLFDWGKPGFNGSKLMVILDRIIAEAGLPVILQATGTPSLDVVVAKLSARTDLNPRGLELRIDHSLLPGLLEYTGRFWKLGVNVEMQVPHDTTLLLRPGELSVHSPGATQVAGKIGASFSYQRPPDNPLLILSIGGSSRVSAEEVTASVILNLRANGQADLTLGADLKRGKVLISTEDADGFIAKILSGFNVDSNFDLGAGYSMSEGLHFNGSSTLEIQLASHVSLGPVEIQALNLLISVDGSAFPVGVSTDLKAGLGPLVGIVQGIGIEVAIALKSDNTGNLGPIDLKPRFKPPKGVGLSLDAGVVRGGGYLYFDTDKEEYAGALELAFAGIVTVKAIGLLTTRMPDGSKGFSLLIIISAEFGSGIQLGFGFILLGVGGLLGLNRTMNLQALMEGVRTGAVESVMFPEDVVANAPKIISDLRVLFPPQEGIFLIGPMAKLGWGTPALVSVSLAIIIEIPGNIAIVGVLKLAIPAEDIALIILQVNFAGAIEFDKKRIYFFAALFESRIVFLTIEGEMGLLVAFGDDANFVVSVGGFHPRFNPPPLPFPSPVRIAVSLLNSSWARVRIEGYFAVTSNTVQFGARVEVYFGLSILNVKGHLAFDTLFQFSPFYFIIEISASLSVNVFGAGIFSVSIGGSLEGPGPWHINGHGSISLLFWDVDVDFETTWGESKDTKLPPVAVMPLFEAEIAKPETWRALPPLSSNLLVTLRKMADEEAASILHPLGVLRVSQRGLPLAITLAKVGTQKPSDVNRLSIAVTGGLAKKNDAFEQFAPAQFSDFGDADKLSKPAFAPERSGVELSAAGADLRSSVMVKRIVRYEEIIIDTNYRRFQRRYRTERGALFGFFLHGAAVTRCEMSWAAKSKLQPFDEKITVSPEKYTVAFQATNKAVTGSATALHSEASAREYMNGMIEQDPALADLLHVIPDCETAV